MNCEKCGKPMVIKDGKNGKFLACSGYPECKNTKPIPQGVSTGGELEKKNEEKKPAVKGKEFAVSCAKDIAIAFLNCEKVSTTKDFDAVVLHYAELIKGLLKESEQ